MVDEQLPRLKHLKQLLAGGDVLSAPHIAKAMEALPGCRIINGYGPTENTTFTCCHTVSSESLQHRSIPIGRPITNTRVYVLDEFQNPVSIGVPGELYIAGDGLAQGYLDRERLTADRFLPNPFEPGTRFYRSGDLVRWLPQANWNSSAGSIARSKFEASAWSSGKLRLRSRFIRMFAIAALRSSTTRRPATPTQAWSYRAGWR